MKKIIRILGLFGVIGLLGIENIQAQQTLQLSLQEAQQYAVEHNAAMQNATLDMKKAELAKWKSISSMLPQVKAAFDYQNMCGYTMNFGGGGMGSYSSMASMLPDSMTVGGTTVPVSYHFPAPTSEENESTGIAMNPSGTFSITASIAFTGAQVVGLMLQNISNRMTDINRQQTEQQTR